MRAFLAVDLHDTLGPVAHAWGQAVAHTIGPRLASGLTWVAASRVHVTLRFFGDLPAGSVDAVVRALAQEGPPCEAFELAIGRGGTFPTHGRPRVLWLGLAPGHDELVALHAWIRGRVDGVVAGDARETFSPHLTVARVRREAGAGLGAALREAAARTPAPPARARVQAVTLMESVLSSRGPTYRPVARFPLPPGDASR